MPYIDEYIVLVFAFLFGAAFGSFIGVIAYRVPRGESIMGRSYCPGCQNQIAGYDNIPVLSWLVLRGRCRKCKSRIPLQSPLEELATALLFVLAAWVGGVSFLTLILFYFAAISVALTIIDWKTLTLPDVIVKPSWVVVGLGLLAYSIIQNDLDIFLMSMLGAAALGGAYLLLWVITMGKGLGFGDVKLAPILGAMLGLFGWPAILVGTAAAWLFGAVYGVAGMFIGKVQRGKPVPFGPFLIIGTWVGIVAHEWVTQAYLGVFGL